MTTQQWEYKRVYLKGDTSSSTNGDPGAFFFYFAKANSDGSQWQDEQLADLGKAGWELVAAVPLTGGRVKEAPSINWGVTYTIGVMLWLKRPLPDR